MHPSIGKAPASAKAAAVLLCALLAAPGAACSDASSSEPVQLLDLAGQQVEPFGSEEVIATVFLFVCTDCPVSNRYAPEVARLHAKFEPLGVDFRLVYAITADTADKIRQHVSAYAYPIEAFRDPEQKLVGLTGATMTPEAAVFTPDRSMVYRGRIDDRYIDYGQTRKEATSHDLERVLTALVAGEEVEFTSTAAIGCFIPDPE